MNEDRPKRVFFDTCIINFIVDHHKVIFSGSEPSERCTPEDIKDLAGLRRILGGKSGANYQIAVSPYTYAEVMSTPDEDRKDLLENWLKPVWDHWISILEQEIDLPTLTTIERFKRQMLALLDLNKTLPDMADRVLLIDALLYGCNYFCTRDKKSILDLKDRAEALTMVHSETSVIAGLTIRPIRVLSPAQLW
jgi:hypothetical protein